VQHLELRSGGVRACAVQRGPGGPGIAAGRQDVRDRGLQAGGYLGRLARGQARPGVLQGLVPMAGPVEAPLMIVGYGVSLATLVLVGVPTAVRFWTIVARRLDGTVPVTAGSVVDTVFFALFSLTELGLLAYVTMRDLRRRRAARQPERNPS
jgi:hypothetical protein